jgi:hypothetical protein
VSREDRLLLLRPYRSPNAMFSKEEESVMLYDPITGNVSKVSGIGKEIWALCDGKRTISDIIGTLYEKYDVQKDVLVGDTLEFVEALMKRGFLLVSK